ncbi:MAG: CPBP family intramembrane metalloprotease [Pyrinomonadaceae bacterium]|nr:CPBP family intramembrane metalloprotease [Pyrinomonadaceae bacterium]
MPTDAIETDPISPARQTAPWEIASVVSSFLIIEWVVQSLADDYQLIGLIPLAFTSLLIFVSQRAHHESAASLGWRTDNFMKAARLLFWPMLAATVFLLLVGWAEKSVGLGALRAKNYSSGMPFPLWLLIWGLMQQFVLQGFVNRRAQLIFGPGWPSVMLVALIFALLHAPNAWLMLATFIGGFVWALVYQRAPNLFALALSHAVMSSVMIATLPAPLVRGMQVGFKALR